MDAGGNAVSETAKGVFTDYAEKIWGVKETENGEFTVGFSSDMSEPDKIGISIDDGRISFLFLAL